MTVRQLLASLDSRELSEWIAYFTLASPPGSRAKPADTQLSTDERIKAFFKTRGKK